MKVFFQLAALLLSIASTPLLAEGDAAAGQAKAAICAACHGTDGNSAVPNWPKLAGQHEQYLLRQSTLIQSGSRPVPEMLGIVAGLTEADFQNIAAFFASQKRTPGVADEALVPAGEMLWRAGNASTGVPACMACHGPAGEGNPLAGYPALAGQHNVYTANMLKKFRAGDHWGEKDANSIVMNGVAAELTDDDINALASYIQGLYRVGE